MEGARGEALAEYMSMPQGQVAALEVEFRLQAGKSVYEAAIEVVMSLRRDRKSS